MAAGSSARYRKLDADVDEDDFEAGQPHDGKKKRLVVGSLLAFFVGVLLVYGLRPGSSAASSCRDTVDRGYQCVPEISRHWGQYSPYFSVPSKIPDDVPHGCEITWASTLARHGARDPTVHKTKLYNETVHKVQTLTPQWSFSGKYAFLKEYRYSLGAGQLNAFGHQEMRNGGIKFYKRYEALAKNHAPFVRTASQARVVDSAESWAKGFHEAKVESQNEDVDFPYGHVVIWEGDEFNNTLDHSRCHEFEKGAYSKVGYNAQEEFIQVFTPPIVQRLNKDLPGVNLTARDAINLMQMCPFDTVADPQGLPSPFCGLFEEVEFRQLGYYETLDKFYGFGKGNKLGATQGVGYVNELLARLTESPVTDETSTNHTLDNDEGTFPLHKKLYADFSHDNDLSGIFFALGLYNSTPAALSKTEVMDEDATAGFSASWAVPFASRAYFEKMKCADDDEGEEMVRIIVNDRVIPLEGCGADDLGRCSLSKFLESQAFARAGGRWNECFT